jgi:sugar transferase (PEP-CTERM/EpsH1 system associated)
VRLLYVTNGFPFPLTSGYLRHYHLLAGLAERHEITLLALAGGGFRREHADALAGIVAEVRVFQTAAPRRVSRRAERAAALVLGRPTPAARRLARVAGELAAGGRFDAAILSGKDTFPALAALARVPLVVDVCDVASLRHRRALAVAPPTRRPALLLAYRHARRVERLLAGAADELVFASERDRAALPLPEGRRPGVAIVPNGVDLAYWRRRSPRVGRDTVVLTGAMHYRPNVDAALFLAREIFPRVRTRLPEAALSLVGRDPAPPLRAVAADPAVTVTGFVDDVRPYLERASVLAAPVRIAAGIQNKLLEALAMEVPVVASSVAADGLRSGTGDELPFAVADAPEAFAAHVVEALLRARAAAAPAVAGRAWVAERFSWPRSVEALDAALERAARRRRTL